MWLLLLLMDDFLRCAFEVNYLNFGVLLFLCLLMLTSNLC